MTADNKQKAGSKNGDMSPKNSKAREGIGNAGWVFAMIIIAYFLDVVDFSIVQVALPTIRSQFGITLAYSQWVIGAYGLTLAGFLMLSGRAGDLFGQKNIFVAGISIFTLASLAGGLAPSFLALIIFRAVQGIGAAMSTVTALAILIEIFPEGSSRNRALGVFVAVLSAGFAAGSVAGGILTVLLGWRSVMFVNVPIGIVAAIISQRVIPNRRDTTKKMSLDLAGALTVTSGLILLVYALTNAGNSDFSLVNTIIPLGISIILLAGFFLIESRAKAPLLPLEFLKRGSVATANLLSLLLSSTLVGISFIITVYLQQILHFSALNAALGMLPAALIFFYVGGWGGAKLINRFGAKSILVVSAILVSGGAALLSRISAQGNYFEVLPGILLWALGASLGFPALNIIGLAGIRPGEEGLASGLLNTSFRVGSPLGLALLLIVAGLAGSGPMGLSNQMASAVSVVTGFRYALVAAALVGLLSVIIAARMKELPLACGPGSQNANCSVLI